MTENLHQKFTTLETQLLAQNAALLEAIGALGAKLDTLITNLAVLSDIHLDTQSIDLKLLRIRDALWPLDDPAISDNRASVVWSLYRLVDSTAPAWPRPVSMPLQPSVEAIRDLVTKSLGINQTGLFEESVLGQLAELINNLGLPTGDATTTVLGRLAAIERLSKCACGPELPSADDPTGCANQIESLQPLVTDPAAENRLFIRWPNLSQHGISFTNEIGLTATNVEIQPAGTWAGWKVLVYSKTANTYNEDPRRSGYWPTNEWRDLTEAQGFPLAFSVVGGNSAVGFLCPPGSVTEGCTTLFEEHVSGEDMILLRTWTGYDYFHAKVFNKVGNINTAAWINGTMIGGNPYGDIDRYWKTSRTDEWKFQVASYLPGSADVLIEGCYGDPPFGTGELVN